MNATQAMNLRNASFRRHSSLPALLGAVGLMLSAPSSAPCFAQCVTVSGTLTISGTVTMKCVNVTPGATLIITNTGTLRLSGNATSTIDGEIRLSGTLAIRNNHTLTGSGVIDGQLADARITVISGKTVTNKMLIAGQLKIAAGGATFTNHSDGIVQADVNGTLEVVDGTIEGAGAWKVSTDPNAVLKFSVAVTNLSGAFTVKSGTLNIDADVCTTGDLTFDGGTIDVAAGKSFKAGGSCP